MYFVGFLVFGKKAKGILLAISTKLKMGMVGGGPGAFIGDVHRKAAQLDGQIEMVAGAFSSNARKSKSMAKVLSLDTRRVYRDYCEMIAKELQLPIRFIGVGEKVDDLRPFEAEQFVNALFAET